MQWPSNDGFKTARWMRVLGVFVMHQFISVLAVALAGEAIAAITFGALSAVGRPQPMSSYHWVLTGIPFFPVQVTIGLALGWGLGRWLHHRSMLWVWIAPLLLFFVWTLTSHVGLPAGAQLAMRIGATEPVFAAAAYSLGALLGQWAHAGEPRGLAPADPLGG